MGAVSESAGATAGTVGWTYTVADHATDYLAAGQTATEKFTVTIDDGHCGKVTQVVTITVTGTNDAPDIHVGSADTAAATPTETNAGLSIFGTLTVTLTINGANDAPAIAAQDLIGAVTEHASFVLSDSGTITFTDVDLTDIHLVSATGTPIGTPLGTLTAVKNGDTTGTGTGGQLTWSYTVADSAVEDLADGETKVESFTITLDDQ